MVILRFPDASTERKALGFLAGRFSFTTWKTGELMISEAALPALAREGVAFSVEGQATYEQLTAAVRDPSAAAVQQQ
jgi:hypothetical protein